MKINCINWISTSRLFEVSIISFSVIPLEAQTQHNTTQHNTESSEFVTNPLSLSQPLSKLWSGSVTHSIFVCFAFGLLSVTFTDSPNNTSSFDFDPLYSAYNSALLFTLFFWLKCWLNLILSSSIYLGTSENTVTF